MSRKKTKTGLLAALTRAIELAHKGSLQGKVELTFVTCYRGQLVAKVMGQGGCTGYYWRWHEFRPECEADHFWATSFEDAFKDIDEMIAICSRNRRKHDIDRYDPREDIGQV